MSTHPVKICDIDCPKVLKPRILAMLYNNREQAADTNCNRQLETPPLRAAVRGPPFSYNYCTPEIGSCDNWTTARHSRTATPILALGTIHQEQSTHKRHPAMLTKSEYCEVPNCGKLLWVSRDSHKSRSTPSLVTGGSNNNDMFPYNIRTGLRIQPFTPQPSQKQSYLANQSAIRTALPLVMCQSQAGRRSTRKTAIDKQKKCINNHPNPT